MKCTNLLSRRGALCLLMMTFVSLHGFGQANNALAFPSANNGFLGASGAASSSTSVDVDLYTGTAQVNVSICQLASKELSIPVSLFYSGGRGHRVQDYAGPAGLGWQLAAGGGISRVVRGFPDELPNGYLGTGLWGQQVASSAVNSTALPSQITGANSGLSAPTADGEPDLFFVKTPFFGVQFTFDENGNPVFPGNTGLKIITNNFYNSGNYTNSSFEVIDDKGTQYYFGSSTLSVENTTTTLYGTSYTFPTTWYLDKIVTLNSKDVVTLGYTFGPYDTTYHYTGIATFDAYGNSNYDTTHPVTNIYGPIRYVSSIVSSLGEADFNYAFDRQDDKNAARLTSIVTKAYNTKTQSNSTVLQTYNFNYSYFGTPSADPNVLRLGLNNITMTGNTAATATPQTLKSFTYNTTLDLPSRKSLALLDYWGYYTNVSNPFPNNIRSPHLSNAEADILTGITDITGGSWQISYELNDYYYSGVNTVVGGLRVNKLERKLPTGEDLFNTYSYVDASGHSTGQIFSSSYNIIGFIWGNPAVVEEILSESPSEIYDLNDNFVGYSSVKVTGRNGGYTTSQFSNFSDYQDLMNYLNTANANTVPDVTSTVSLSYKRGLQLDKAVYNAAGNILSEDITPLTAYSSLTSPAQKKSWAYKWNSVSYSVGGASGSNICASSYWSYVENYRLVQAIHRDYDQANPARYVQTTTNYAYSPVNHRLIDTISTTDSKGAAFVKTYFHVDDTNIPMLTGSETTAIDTLLNHNATGVVVHESSSRNGVVHQAHTSFSTALSGSNTNVYGTTVSAYLGSTLERQQFLTYDPTTSNLLSSNTTNGKVTSTLYGYNASLPMMTAVNATPTEIYYESFEGPASDTNVVLGAAYTGNYYYNGNYTVSYSIPDSKSYVIQWWKYAGGVWNFNEQSYTGATTLTGPVDDIRIFPSDAKVSTDTYWPLTGKSGEIDPSGKTINYEYDGLGRMSAVRDQDKNLVKKLCYTYTGQTESCSTTYYSNAITRTFTRNNCSPAVGSTLTYTVTPGKYTSASSQGDADSQAQSDMTTNGQNYANANGTCTIPVTLVNNCAATTVITVIFTNGSNTYAGSFNPLPGGTSTIVLPAGAATYNISLTVKFGTNQLFTINGQQKVGSSVTYTGVGISSPVTLTACDPYYNTAHSGTFTRNNCTAGQLGTPVTYTVAANTYLACSQAAAEQLAANDVTNNGQAYANSHGFCVTPGVTLVNNASALGICIVSFKQGSTTVATATFPDTQGANTTITTVPNGTYTVQIQIKMGTVNKKFTIGTTSMTGTFVTFTNIAISNTTNVTITATDN
jgi:YD repeat-containing protein